MSAACHIRPPIGDIKIPCLSSNVSTASRALSAAANWVSFPKIHVVGIAAMLDVGQLWMHIIGGIPGTVLGRLPHSGLRSRAQQPYQQQHRGYVLQEWHDIWTNQTGSS